jgi:prolyl 4-hydroxylase
MQGSPDPRTRLDARALAWLRERVYLGADLDETIAMLRRQGATEGAIIAGFEAVRPRVDAVRSGDMTTPPLLRRAPGNLRRVDAPGIDLFTLEDFLDQDECLRLIDLISGHLRPSQVAADYAAAGARTSQTAYLAHLASPVVDALDDKICRTLGLRAPYGEGIQAQRYDVGQEFKPHYDAFLPGSDAYRRRAALRGNRTWTFMVYLNDGMEGGATRFTEIGQAVTPRTGRAVLWNNLDAHGAPNRVTRHCGEPVTSGHKVIITKWFRAIGDGPVFHDAT